jgi:hypothetical protein
MNALRAGLLDRKILIKMYSPIKKNNIYYNKNKGGHTGNIVSGTHCRMYKSSQIGTVRT